MNIDKIKVQAKKELDEETNEDKEYSIFKSAIDTFCDKDCWNIINTQEVDDE